MKYLSIIFVLLTLAACQNDQAVSQDNDIKLFADYYIRYLQNEQELKAEATFSRGLTKTTAKKVDLEGTLALSGRPLKPVRLNKSIFRYQLEEKKPFQSNYSFDLELDKGQTNKHQIPISPIGKFSLKNGKASKKEGFELTWDGADLKKNERLLVLITDKNSKAHSISVSGPSTGQTVAIKGVDLQPLVTGNGYIYLVKKIENQVNDADMVIHSLAEYYSDRILVEIVE